MDLLREKLRALGHHCLRCQDSPDVTPQLRMAEASEKLGRDALEWYQSQAEAQRPLIERAANRADQVSLAQLGSMENQTRLSNEAEGFRKRVFQPVEERIVSDSMRFNEAAERERLAGLAGGDVAQAFGAQRDQLRRDTGRAGINPGDPGYTVALGNLASREALTTAHLKNKTRADARTVGRAQLMDAASLGRNLPSQQATAAQLALSSGNSAVGNAQVPVSLASANTNLAGQGYSAALQGTGQSANIYGQISKIQSEPNNDLANLAQLGMAGAKLWASDKNIKTGKKPVKGEVALAAARRMPVKSWKYKQGSVADDGGQQHIGPMAQDVQAAAGNGAAPGGKMIDPISMSGITLAAVQHLDKKVQRLEKRRARA